jgi:hypothetical protein
MTIERVTKQQAIEAVAIIDSCWRYIAEDYLLTMPGRSMTTDEIREVVGDYVGMDKTGHHVRKGLKAFPDGKGFDDWWWAILTWDDRHALISDAITTGACL